MTIPRVGTLALLLCIGMTGVGVPWPSVQEPATSVSPFNLLPVFGPGTNEFIGLSLVNTSAANNEVTVTWTDSDGGGALKANLSLTPGSQHVALLREILAIAEDPVRGSIRLDSSGPGLMSYMTSGREGILDGIESSSLISTQIVLPHVGVNTGFMELEYTDTLVSLINPGNMPARADAELVGLDGSGAGKIMVSIPAHGSRTLRVSESFHETLPPNSVGGRTFRGYMRVSSDEALSGWLRIDTPLSRVFLRGSGVEEIVPARFAMASHFASGGPALYRSELNFINAGDSGVTLELTAQDDRGGKLGSVRRTLGPGQGLREDVLSLFRMAIPAVFPAPMLTGYIRIRAADGGVFHGTGDIDITSGGLAASMLYPVGTAFSSNFVVPFVINDSDYFTGYAIANPNELLTVQTDVTIEISDITGRPIGSPRKVSLSPSARFVDLIDENVASGYLRISANGPVAMVGSLGTRNNGSLALLPAIPGHTSP